MQSIPKWLFDEVAGTDFVDPKKAEDYKRRSGPVKDAQNQVILDFLQLTPDQTVIDLGTGFGSFAVAAAPYCQKVYAVDVSAAMLELTRKNAESKGLANISLLQGGYLTYEHQDAPADAIVTRNALHHLPDFWKSVALNRMAKMVKPGGKLHLSDFYFSFNALEYETVLQGWMQSAQDVKQADIRAQLTRAEYPTFTWIIEEMIQRAGFEIQSHRYATTGIAAFYQCVRR
jgi:putative AdoMet-dependent methyltransferase